MCQMGSISQLLFTKFDVSDKVNFLTFIFLNFYIQNLITLEKYVMRITNGYQMLTVKLLLT